VQVLQEFLHHQNHWYLVLHLLQGILLLIKTSALPVRRGGSSALPLDVSAKFRLYHHPYLRGFTHQSLRNPIKGFLLIVSIFKIFTALRLVPKA